jgi:uncharacterized protein YdeI (YjbR/CyaY-like superfamily)
MDVTLKHKALCRADWRSWLAANNQTATEVWLISDDRPGQRTVSYLDSVEEAICFGWIDGIAKRISDSEIGQRFTPRRPRSNWTELNKERARRLIKLGLMTPAGERKLPDLSQRFEIANDILEAIHADADAKSNFDRFPDLYIRVRLGYIEEMRKRPEEFSRRLQTFLQRTASGKMFGNWNDDGRLL